MSDDHRSLTFEIEVPGGPEEVWRAIATGPGISSWYVPHTVEERDGGPATASFGPEPEMQVSGRVAVWEPPYRIVFDGGEGVEGLGASRSTHAPALTASASIGTSPTAIPSPTDGKHTSSPDEAPELSPTNSAPPTAAPK